VRHATVTNCTARGTGDDSFAIWPAAYAVQSYAPGMNVITHCTAQSPWFANTCGIYGGEGNRVEDCRFVDIPYGAGILIAGTFPVGTNSYSGITVAQRCDVIRGGGYDPGWQWRGALTLCPHNLDIPGLQVDQINLSNSLSYAVQIVSPGSGGLSSTEMIGVNVSDTELGSRRITRVPNQSYYVDGVYGVLARNDAKAT